MVECLVAWLGRNDYNCFIDFFKLDIPLASPSPLLSVSWTAKEHGNTSSHS